jgi:hypothetical protein
MVLTAMTMPPVRATPSGEAPRSNAGNTKASSTPTVMAMPASANNPRSRPNATTATPNTTARMTSGDRRSTSANA